MFKVTKTILKIIKSKSKINNNKLVFFSIFMPYIDNCNNKQKIAISKNELFGKCIKY